MLRKNVGGLDRCVRVMLGTMLVMMGLCLLVGTCPLGGILAQWMGLAVAIVGLVLLVTGLLGFCPLYLPLGISTAGEGGGDCCETHPTSPPRGQA
jgi:hypothetical protein